MRFRALPFALALAAFVPTLGERAAHACGGTFCDGPTPQQPMPMPVGQSGENIVFAVDKDPSTGKGTVTAYIQILYSGTASDFSWVLPIDAVPDITNNQVQINTTGAGALSD